MGKTYANTGALGSFDQGVRAGEQSNLGATYNEGPADALRHAYAARLAAQKYGPTATKLAGRVFEGLSNLTQGNLPWTDTNANNMDIRNNAIGADSMVPGETPAQAYKSLMGLMVNANGTSATSQLPRWNDGTPVQKVPTQGMYWNRQHFAATPDQTAVTLRELQVNPRY